MRCDCLCCVMSRDAMRCHGDELLSAVPCNGMECYELKMPLVVRSRWLEVVLWRCGDLNYLSIHSTTPVLLCTTTPVLQSTENSVLQSTTPVLLCTAKHNNVQLQHCPVLPSIATYYSSTTLYCKVLLHYYSVLQSTTPVLLCTTKYYSRTTLYSTTAVLLCTTTYYSSTTLYYKVPLQYYSVLQNTSPVLLCTTKYYSSTTLYCKVLLHLQLHQIRGLPGKIILMIDPGHMWNAIFNAQSNRSHPPTSQNTASGTKNLSWLIRITYETSVLPRKMTLMMDPRHIWNVISRIFRAWNRHHPPLRRPYSSDLGDEFCIEKYNASRSGYLPKSHQMLRLPRKVTVHLLQILRLPRKKNVTMDANHIWNPICIARSIRSHPPTSPNTAPATQNKSHDWSASHMKRHLQCAEQVKSPFKLTKYCACPEILSSRFERKIPELLPPK